MDQLILRLIMVHLTVLLILLFTSHLTHPLIRHLNRLHLLTLHLRLLHLQPLHLLYLPTLQHQHMVHHHIMVHHHMLLMESLHTRDCLTFHTITIVNRLTDYLRFLDHPFIVKAKKLKSTKQSKKCIN